MEVDSRVYKKNIVKKREEEIIMLEKERVPVIGA